MRFRFACAQHLQLDIQRPVNVVEWIHTVEAHASAHEHARSYYELVRRLIVPICSSISFVEGLFLVEFFELHATLECMLKLLLRMSEALSNASRLRRVMGMLFVDSWLFCICFLSYSTESRSPKKCI